MKPSICGALVVALLLGADLARGQDRGMGGIVNFDDSKDKRADQEAFIQKLIEIIEKTASQAEDNDLDRTPYGALEPADQEVGAEIARRLDAQRMSINFDDNTFADAIDFIRDATNLNIVLSKRAKDLTENAPKIKLKLRDVKVRNALEITLTQTDAQLRYGVRNGVLEIGTVEDWKGRNMYVAVIPIDELLYSPPDYPAPEAGLEALTKGNKFKK
jgi:hypothetical protein